MKKVLAVIPARYDSKRLPGKPLIEIAGKTIIQRVYERVSKSNEVQEVVVATDNELIEQHVQGFSGKVVMTAKSHRNGTERCAEVARKMPNDFDIVLNIQGDEPLIEPTQIDLLVQLFKEDESTEIGTLVKKVEKLENLLVNTEVKVIFNQKQEAIYFSRSPIPFLRNFPQEEWLKNHKFYKHVGIYGFRNDVLQKVIQLPVSALEKAESLEQLRWITAHKIRVGITEIDTFSIDVPEDIERLKKYFENLG